MKIKMILIRIVARIFLKFILGVLQDNSNDDHVHLCYARLLPKIYMHNTVELNTQPTAM